MESFLSIQVPVFYRWQGVMRRKIIVYRHDGDKVVLQRPLVGLLALFELLEDTGQPEVFPVVRVPARVELLQPSRPGLPAHLDPFDLLSRNRRDDHIQANPVRKPFRQGRARDLPDKVAAGADRAACVTARGQDRQTLPGAGSRTLAAWQAARFHGTG